MLFEKSFFPIWENFSHFLHLHVSFSVFYAIYNTTFWENMIE